jgi:hypothetical protein
MNRQLLLRLMIVMLSVVEWIIVREVMIVKYRRVVYLTNGRFGVIGVRSYSRNEGTSRVVAMRAILSVFH